MATISSRNIRSITKKFIPLPTRSNSQFADELTTLHRDISKKKTELEEKKSKFKSMDDGTYQYSPNNNNAHVARLLENGKRIEQNAAEISKLENEIKNMESKLVSIGEDFSSSGNNENNKVGSTGGTKNRKRSTYRKSRKQRNSRKQRKSRR